MREADLKVKFKNYSKLKNPQIFRKSQEKSSLVNTITTVEATKMMMKCAQNQLQWCFYKSVLDTLALDAEELKKKFLKIRKFSYERI